jgi:ADP-L-glycero-D-manno-heptose 6-epimerase
VIVVTGANGFIGSAMVWQLNEQGEDDIVGVDTVGLRERPDLLQKRRYRKFLLKDQLWDFLNQPEAQEITWVIHMGANSSTTETNWQHLYENNTFYTQRIFEWCAQHKKNLIYASSAATYGAGELGYDDQTDSEQLRPLNLYGKSKVIFDQWTRRQTKTPPHWYGLKFFNVYGPQEYHKGPMASLVFKAFHQIREHKEMKLFKSYLPEYKDGEQMRDFVYVKDVTAWMSELMQKKPSNGIYNMGYGRARTWVDLAKAVFRALSQKENIHFIEMPENLKNQYQYFTEARMQKWIGKGLSEPKWPIERGVEDYVKNYLMKSDQYL